MVAVAPFCALLFLQPTAVRAAEPARIAIHVSPDLILMDDVVHLHVSGLSAKQAVTLRARFGMGGKLWQAQASFVADERGQVDLTRQAPTVGTYSGIDPMGLFWSMEPSKEPLPKEYSRAFKITDAGVTRLEVLVGDRPVASTEIKRYWLRPGVRVSDVREHGLVGRFFEPEKLGRYPAVLTLSGSEGGMYATEAALLASRGYTALALAYFGAPGLPRDLVFIRLEYLQKGVDWLKTQASVDSDRLGIVGGSKGAELGLMFAAHFPQIKVVIASAPSHVAWFGLGGLYQESSWSFKDKPVPFVPVRPTFSFLAQMTATKPIAYCELFESCLKNEASVKKAVIPVEKINGAILLISGKDDRLWPSSVMADKVMERLKEHKHLYAYRHLCYEDAGHGIMNAYLPTRPTLVTGRYILGGSVQANARALADSRPKVLRFLHDNLAQINNK
jgi:dienelactone hydrolase